MIPGDSRPLTPLGVAVAPAISFGPVRIWPLPAGAPAQIIPATDAAPPHDDRALRRWTLLCQQNPRLHEGPIWNVRAFDPLHAVIAVAPDLYSRYAVRPSIGVGVAMLAVRGVITATDSAGQPHVLMGLRSPQTRIYGDMWEVIPGGGMPGPAAASSAPLPTSSDLIDHLRVEAREEAGLGLSPDECRVLGVCDDTHAGGFDVLIRVQLARSLEQARREMGDRDWEHRQVEWMPVAHVQAFDAQHAAKISPPTRAIIRYLDWVHSGD